METPMDPHEPPPEDVELYERVGAAVADTLRGAGLHALDVKFARDEASGSHVILGSFLIGDLAMSDRVQNPEASTVKDVFTELSQDLVDQHILELQQELQRRDNDGDAAKEEGDEA